GSGLQVRARAPPSPRSPACIRAASDATVTIAEWYFCDHFRLSALWVAKPARQKHREDRPVAAHRFLNPSTMPATRGYTHVVETRGPSRTIYLAGQLGMTPDGKFAGGAGDFRAQATQAFENVKLALAAAGATFQHVVKVTAYFTDIAHLQAYFEVRDRYVN